METETEDGIYSVCEGEEEYSGKSEQDYSESEKETNGSSVGRYTSGSGISDVAFDSEGRLRTQEDTRRTIISRAGTSEEESSEESSTAGFVGESEITIREESASQLTERTDQPGRALRSRGAAPAIQLGKGESVAAVTEVAWISKDKGTKNTILRDETDCPEHRRHKDDLDDQLRGGSLKTLTVGQEDDQPPSLPPEGVERNQREPADLTGISGAATGEDLQPACQEQLIQYPLVVKGLGTSLDRDISEEKTNYQVVEQTETPSRDPRKIGSEATPVARQLQFNFSTEEGTRLLERRREEEERRRHSNEVIHYEVGAIINLDSSNTDLRRDNELEESSELPSRRNEELERASKLPEIEEIVPVQANEEVVTVHVNTGITIVQIHEEIISLEATEEEEQEADHEAEELELKELEEEEEEQGAKARGTRNFEASTQLVETTEEDEQEVGDTPVKEASFSKIPIAETEADLNREVVIALSINADIQEKRKTVIPEQASPVPELVVVSQRTEEQEILTSIQQDEPVEVELLGTLDDVIGNTEHSAFSVEIALGPGGVYTAKYPTGHDPLGESEDSNDEDIRESLSKKEEEVQEATIWVPEVIVRTEKSIHSSQGSETREEEKEAEVSSEDRRSGAETPQDTEENETATRNLATLENEDISVKHETDDELYCKLLRVVICYKREKATYEQYQIYKAQIAELTKRKLEAEPGHTSPTLEAQRKVEELINKAEKVATDRSARLKEVQEEALRVSTTIEKARWRVYESFKKQIGLDPKSIVEDPGLKVQEIIAPNLVGGNQQTQETLVTNSLEREELQKQTLRQEDLQKERLRREELRREKAQREEFRKEKPRKEELKTSRITINQDKEITCERRVVEITQQTQEEFSDIIEKTKTGREVSTPRKQQEDLVVKEIFNPRWEETHILSEEEEVTGLIYRNGDEIGQNQGFRLLKDDRGWNKITEATDIQRKECQLNSERTATREREATPVAEGLSSRTKTWVEQHPRQLASESGEELGLLRWSVSPIESGKQPTSGGKELNPIELKDTPPRRVTPTRSSNTPGGSSGYLGEAWGRIEGAMARLPNIKLPLFYGKENENYERFFDEMAGLQRISGWSPDEYLDIVKIGIKGGAATWLKAVPRADQDSLPKIRAIIKEAFGDKRPRWQKHRDLHNLRQEKGQSVRDFALKIKEYALPDDVDDGQLLSVFVAGLPRHIGMELAKSELTTLDRAVAQAVRIESVDKRSTDRKPEVMVLEVGRQVEPRREEQVEVNMRNFDGMMENQFLEYQPQNQPTQRGYGQPQDLPNQRGYTRGQSNYRGRGRYQNQGEYNNRVQGSQPSRALSEYEYKQRSLARAAEYKRMMKLQTGGAAVRPVDVEEGGTMQRYCIIHDSRSHTTAQCDLVKDIYQQQEAPPIQNRTKQVTFVPTNQGN